MLAANDDKLADQLEQFRTRQTQTAVEMKLPT
jgi:hypothetical protein